MDDSYWYDKGPLLSHNAMLNFVVSERGTGKTMAFKIWALKKEQSTLWIRRRKDDSDRFGKYGFVEDLKDIDDIDTDTIVSDSKKLVYKDKIKIKFISLSTSLKIKSNSFMDTDLIVFDEFIEKFQDRYLKEEVFLFLELIETVNRARELIGKPSVRVICLGNGISFSNPYFSYFGIKRQNQEFSLYHDGTICVQIYHNNKFADAKSKTMFGKLVRGTRYGNYLIDGSSFINDDAFISPKPSDAVQEGVIKIGDHTLYLWKSSDGDWYITKKGDPSLITYSDSNIMKEEEFNISILLPMLKKLSNFGQLYYEDGICKGLISQIV